MTGEVFTFFNTKDAELLKMFGLDTVTKGIKSGKQIGGKRSKYPNPCIIERISNSYEKTEERGQKIK